MLEKTRLKFHRILNAILIAVLASISGVMYVSAHGGDMTLIHACANNRSGAVRIVSATTTCEANKETALDWSIQGPKGDTGDVGPIGPQGPAGGAARYYERYQTVGPIQPGAWFSTGANCDQGDQIVSGGFSVNNTSASVDIMDSEPNRAQFQLEGWVIAFRNVGTVETEFTTIATCADTTP